MYKHSIIERIQHKLYIKTNFIFSKFRTKELKNIDFTIISNNCWGGICYEHYGLPKLSPTVGLYFYADDYIKFISNLEYYTSLDIDFIDARRSKYSDDLLRKNEWQKPIGVLDDVEIVFLHYKNAKEAKQKWERRVKRINWDNLILKFSYMNNCNDQHIHEFYKICNLHHYKHFCLVPKLIPGYENMYIVQDCKGSQILDDTFYWNSYFDVKDFLNSKF